MKGHNRWNIEETGDGGIRICKGEHDNSALCEWVDYVTREAMEDALDRQAIADADREALGDV